MAYLRLSKAKYQYQCDKCSRWIYKGQEYFRIDPFPIARIKGTAEVKHLCKICVFSEENVEQVDGETREWLRNHWSTSYEQYPPYVQMSFSDIPISVIETKVHVIDITSDILKKLAENPEAIYNLTPVAFETLICDRLDAMGFGVKQVGGHTYRKDGGIDIMAWPKQPEFPFFMAVQAKYHHSPKYKTGSPAIRDLISVVQNFPFHAGVLVTNTTFTPDAKWFAKQHSSIIRLRDIQDIRRWLENNFLDEYDWREIPEKIEVCPGIIIEIPRTKS